MKGLFLRRVYSEAKPTGCTITVTGTGDATSCYLIINGVKAQSAGTYTVPVGDTIECTVKSTSSSYQSYIKLNGNYEERGSNVTLTYDYEVAKNATINLTTSYAGGRITITEG